MDLINRFFKFFIGFLIGSVLVYFLLIKDRDRNLKGWLPAERVVQEIQDHELIISKDAACQLKCLDISHNDLLALVKNAKVDFGQSKVRIKPCPSYVLESGLNKKSAILEIQKCEKSATLINIKVVGQKCECS